MTIIVRSNNKLTLSVNKKTGKFQFDSVQKLLFLVNVFLRLILFDLLQF